MDSATNLRCQLHAGTEWSICAVGHAASVYYSGRHLHIAYSSWQRIHRWAGPVEYCQPFADFRPCPHGVFLTRTI